MSAVGRSVGCRHGELALCRVVAGRAKTTLLPWIDCMLKGDNARRRFLASHGNSRLTSHNYTDDEAGRQQWLLWMVTMSVLDGECTPGGRRVTPSFLHSRAP